MTGTYTQAPKAAGMHGWAPEVIGAVGKPGSDPDGYLRVFYAQTSNSRDAGRRSLERMFARQADRDTPTTWPDPAGPIRRRVRMGYPRPLLPATSSGDPRRGPGRQRRQRPHGPTPLLLPAGRAHPKRQRQDLPRRSPRVPVPAPLGVRRRCPRLSQPLKSRLPSSQAAH